MTASDLGHAVITHLWPASRAFDFYLRRWHLSLVKAAKPTAEKKTAGTLAVEKHRPLMNKLSTADRQRLRQRAAELLYGHEAAAPGR
jgi:hypothetical protein